MGKLRQILRADLESPEAERAFGSGWISGVLALALAVMGLGAVVFLMFPSLFSMPMLREYYGYPLFRLGNLVNVCPHRRRAAQAALSRRGAQEGFSRAARRRKPWAGESRRWGPRDWAAGSHRGSL